MPLIGYKNNKNLYRNLLGDLVPNYIDIYVEPFGGEFGLYQLLENKPVLSIYNEINIILYNKIYKKFSKNENLIFFNKDYKEIIEEYDSEKTFFYIDPPYFENEHYYENHNFLTKEDHVELSHVIKTIKGRFLLSYQDNDFIRNLYDSYNIYNYTGSNIKFKKEIAITNY